MAQQRTKSKELDHYLKSVISGVPKKLDHFLSGNESKMTYYTGNWSTDVCNNFIGFIFFVFSFYSVFYLRNEINDE